ncbi:MAG: DUF4249 domain-containing protein [Bacteroidales bacterium]|nr:DUF4249 domain-containing protein [Bacteroidales bacterium]
MKKVCFLICLAAIICSCIYDYEPKDAKLQGLSTPLVVIDGDIIVGGITNVKVSFTQSITEDIENEVPTGTAVWVEDEDGTIYTGKLAEGTPGTFEVDTQNLLTDKKYRLAVSIPGRGECVSEYGEVMISPPIDEITWSFVPDSSYANVEVTTHNSQEKKLYCKWNYAENWESDAVHIPYLDFNPNTSILRDLTPDETAERAYCFSEAVSTDICIASTEKLAENIISKSVIRRIANTDMRARGLYAITVSQKALDKEAFLYWETLNKNIGSTGGIFSAQPSEHRGNITSLTSPEEVVIGYISVSTQTQMRAFIDWKTMKFFKAECVFHILKESSEDFYKDLKNYFHNGYRPVFRQKELGELYLSALKCTDCRSYSNSTRPDFWPVE